MNSIPNDFRDGRVRIQRDADVATCIDDAWMILELASGKYVCLRGTGAAIWEALSEPVDCDELVAKLQERYSVDEERCRTDVVAVIAKLSAINFVRSVPAGG